MEDYVAKPVRKRDIIKVLKKWLPHKITSTDQSGKRTDQAKKSNTPSLPIKKHKTKKATNATRPLPIRKKRTTNKNALVKNAVKKTPIQKLQKTHQDNVKQLDSSILIDPDRVNEMKDLMGDSFKDFIHKYLDNAEQMIQNACNMAQEGNMQEVHNVTHTLKSSSASLGAQKVAALAEEIESSSLTYIKSSDTPSESIQQDLESLKNYFTQTKPLLKDMAA